MLVLVDVDSVIADLMPEWLRLYNLDYGDDVSVNEITEWDMTKFVHPDCGNHIYKYLERKTLYDHVEIIEGSLRGVDYIRSLGHRVIFATSGVHTTAKYKWLERNGFNPGKNAEDYVVIYDKTLLRGDVLIDDRESNVWNFTSAGGKAILFNQPWNQNIEWKKRAYNWEDVIRILEEIS